MDAVAAQLGGEIGPVVHQEGDVARLRDRHQDFGGAADVVVRDVLQPQLQPGDVAGLERARQRVGKTARARAWAA